MKVQARGDVVVVVDDDDGLESFLFIIFMTLYTTAAAAAVGFPLLLVCLVEGLHTQSLRLFCFAVFVSGESPAAAVTGERHLPP